MEMKIYFVLSLIVLLCSSVTRCFATQKHTHRNTAFSLNQSSFPSDFIFGAGSSSYQCEGAASEDGRGPSIWDTFTHKHPEKIKDHTNGDVAADLYHKYKEDVKLMRDMNLNAYRFSISWSRILPNGSVSGGVNQKGIEFYNNLINELVANGIEPFVTLFHFDLPQALEDKYGGFLSPLSVDDFRDYAEICFEHFGDRVKHWTTLNEPWIYSIIGYSLGLFPPGHCSMPEAYLVLHHQLLAHAAAANLYRHKYQATQQGKIGVTLLQDWVKPYNSSFSGQSNVKKMVKTAFDFTLGLFLNPLTRGNYPHSLRKLVGHRLPKLTKKQSKMIKGSFDFLGLNYYRSLYVSPHPPEPSVLGNITCIPDVDRFVNFTDEHGGPLTHKGQPDTDTIYPKGIRLVLRHIKYKYNNPPVYIMENGKDHPNNYTSVKDALDDQFRIDYFRQHLHYVHKAIKDGVNVKGYFVWSLLDGFEWAYGFTLGVGINYVDRKDGLKRYPKMSARWFKNFLRK